MDLTKIVRLREGEFTYREIAEVFGVSRQRIHQIIKRDAPTLCSYTSYHHLMTSKGFKKCTICKQYKELSLFCKNRSKWDGLQAYCKDCAARRANHYYYRNKSKVGARALARYHYPVQQPCEIPGCNLIGNRHHDDYSRPLNIRWLCKEHHPKI